MSWKAMAMAGVLTIVGAAAARADGPRGGDYRGPRPGGHLPPNGNPGPFPPRIPTGGVGRPGGRWPVPPVYWPAPAYWPGRYPGGWGPYGPPYRPYWPNTYGGWYGGPRW